MKFDNTDHEFDLGLLEPLMLRDDVTEIMVNGTANIYIEVKGKLVETEIAFDSEEAVLATIQNIITPLGHHISDKTPIIDGRLPDGSRFNAVIRPVALTGPTLTIRKFSKRPLTIEQLIAFGSWTQKTVDFIEACVKARMNLILSGGTSSGKTTVFNLMSSFVPEDERIVTVESVAELQLQHKHIVVLEARPPAPDGTGKIDMAMLLTNAARMRPDRIIAGEIRGGEAWDMLQVMTTGYDGSMFTVHAVDVDDALNRIEMWCASTTTVPILQVRAKIAQAIHVVIQQDRLSDGKRKITNISEVVGLTNNSIETRPIMKFVQTGEVDGKIQGEARFTGYIPTFAKRLDLPESFFVE